MPFVARQALLQTLPFALGQPPLLPAVIANKIFSRVKCTARHHQGEKKCCCSKNSHLQSLLLVASCVNNRLISPELEFVHQQLLGLGKATRQRCFYVCNFRRLFRRLHQTIRTRKLRSAFKHSDDSQRTRSNPCCPPNNEYPTCFFKVVAKSSAAFLRCASSSACSFSFHSLF